ncbi:MAG: Gfo/Idh/MocA family oxidoreductase [SAR202 cluster bacterium]|nr:Gfo/Idh/MocA family oxidoreductase [SAR202 cluster bacterium]
MAQTKVRVALIGAGANTRLRHIPGFKAIKGVDIVGVANRTRESGKRITDEYGIPTVYDHWTEAVTDPDANAVCIGTWPYMHRVMVEASLEHGKHVLTEARMAMDALEARSMLDASRAHPDLVTHIVPAPLTLKVDRTIQRLIAEGYAGDLLSVDLISHLGGFVDRDGPMHWRYDRDFSGYNIMFMGIWYETLMRWIGPASSVTALTRVTVTSRKDAGGQRHVINIPDHVEVLAEMASGPVARMRFSSVTGHPPADQVWLFGSEGTLHLDVPTMTLSGGQRKDKALSPISIPAKEQGEWRVEEEFVNAIRGTEKVHLTSFEDGVKYMEFTEAVTRSAQERRTISLPL